MGKGRTLSDPRDFRKAGDLGLLGISKPEKFGGMGLDYSYSIVAAEEFGTIHCGGIPMSIGVQTDMCTPALARFGSDELRDEFLRPAISGEQVGCIGVSEVGAGSDVAGLKTTARKDGDDYVINGSKMWITNSPSADFHLPAGQHLGRQAAHQQVADHGADEHPGHQPQPAPGQTRHAQLGDRPGVFRQRARAATQPHRPRRRGLHDADAAVPGRTPVRRGQHDQGLEYCVDSTIDYCKERKTFGRR
jgi:citronellyl-CoA dehydrogenase